MVSPKSIWTSFLLVGTLLLCVSPVKAQWLDGNAGVHIGATFNFGSRINRLGIVVGGYYAYDHLQATIQTRLLQNIKAYGNGQSGLEWQISAGGLLAFGPQDSTTHRFFHPLANFTTYKHSIAYAFNSYREAHTPQQTGSISLQFGPIEFITENDALAFGGKDRFRTGALQVAYRIEDFRFTLNTSLWTGDTHDQNAHWVKDPGDYPCRYGYKDLSKAPFGQTSHGILSLQVQALLPYDQQVDGRIGIDAEQVRHWLQNKLMHDTFSLPEHWKAPKNPHLPMLDANGQPFLFKEGQEIRPVYLFGNVGLNSSLFY